MVGQVTFTTEAKIGWIRFDNATKRNAMTMEMWQSLGQHLTLAAKTAEVRAIILIGAGTEAFVAGSDISTFAEKRSSPEAANAYAKAVAEALSLLARFPKPVVAAIRGACVGGGLSIAMAADLRLAGSDALFAIPAGRLGIGYSVDQIERLRAQVGAGLASRLIFLAERLGAAEAQQLGMVQSVVPSEAFEAKLADWARALAENAPLSLTAAKQAMVALSSDAAAGDLQRAEAAIAACMASEDYREGQRAFAEKRRPAFRGV